MLRDIWRDIRYGVRLLLRNPAFTIIAVLSLGLGIGANTAMFQAVDALMLTKLPVEQPERLVLLFPYDSPPVRSGSIPYPALHKLEQQGWITAEWKASENNRRAKFYSLTRTGRSHLARETESWTRLSVAITLIVGLPET
jgi:Transcriptional regulator PadR-like family